MRRGDTFTRLTVVSIIDRGHIECRCRCGTVKVFLTHNVLSERTKSCGCIRHEQLAKRNETHGLSKHRLHQTHKNMLQRCYNPRHPRYDDWGGRGIRVCREWRHPTEGLAAFVAWNESLPRAERWRQGLTLERDDNERGYGPHNCRWATYVEQNNNQRGRAKYRVRGEHLTLPELARKYSLKPGRIKQRLNRGWSIRDAMRVPAYAYRERRAS